jgi:hypothetical protein
MKPTIAMHGKPPAGLNIMECNGDRASFALRGQLFQIFA